MLTFPKVPLVSAENPLRSKDVAAMARAMKARDLSGVGNTVWRRVMWAYNAFRQVRNPDENGAFPTQGEFFELYQHLDPENNPSRWPETGPGEFEGLNLSSIMNGFVFGGSNFFAEQFRMGDGAVPLWAGNKPPSTPEEFWELAKLQRGVIDPIGGVQNVPALQAAQSGSITAGGSISNPHGKTWGGIFPTPLELSTCGSGEWADVSNYQLFFTALNDGAVSSGFHGTVTTNGDGRAVVTYNGSCPSASEVGAAPGHVQFIARTSKYYVVFVTADGGQTVLDFFSVRDWVEGPYAGNGYLFRYDGGHISRALWAFVKDFRGTAEQRTPDDFNIEDLAFNFQDFFEKQYHLSPNIGTFDGVENIGANYPTAKVSAASGETIPEGTFLGFGRTNKATQHTYTKGFVMTGCFAKATNLFAPVTLEVLNGTKIIARLTLTPGAPTALEYFAAAENPEPLRVRLASKAKFTAGGSITFEANEIAEYLPDHWDAYLMLRLAGTSGGFETEGRFLDGSGVDETQSARIFRDYAKHGCIVNTVAAGVRSIETYASENPVYDSMRRFTRDFMRIVQRRQFLSYEVTGGKAILRFKRWAFGMKNQKADYFHGIAPSWRGVAEVVEGEQYIVRAHAGGVIVYGGKKLRHGKKFIGQKGIATFEAKDGAVLLEYEGIKKTARRKGWTNEWCMFMNFHPYHPSDSSLWKLESYGDHFTWNNRAHAFAHGSPLNLKQMATVYQAAYPSAWHSPESPDSFNYFGGANGSADDDFRRSNPIFKKPYDLESATVEFDENNNDVVRLVFKERFQTHPDAPASVDVNPGTWSGGELSELAGEDYRTDDNALRQYCALSQLQNHSYWKKGDDAFNSTMQMNPDNPFACCIPHFFFAKLPEEPYSDGNDSLDEHDSRVVIDNFMWWEVWLKAGCEGFVNGTSTRAHICENEYGQPYDYFFEDLTYDANGKRFIGDFQTGHGPMVNTAPLASLFNEYANCINLLNKVQVHNLFEFQTRTRTFEGATSISATWAGSGGANCPPGASGSFWWDGCPPATSLISTSEWGGPASGAGASATAGVFQCGPDDTPTGAGQTRTQDDFRYVPIASFENAIPEEIKELMAQGSASVWGYGTSTQTTFSKVISDPFTPPFCFSGAFNIDAETGYTFVPSYTETSPTCMEISHGSIEAVVVPCGTFASCSKIFNGHIEQGSVTLASAGFSFIKTSSEASAVCTIPLVAQEVAS